MGIESASFGYHALGSAAPEHVNEVQSAVFYLNIAHKVTLVASVILGFVIGVTIPIILSIAMTAFYYGVKIYSQEQICKTAGMVINDHQQIQEYKLDPQLGECEMLPTEHCADTELWREKLVEAAEHNIVISGNYCGGKSFVDFLELIERNMDRKEKLKVVIISSPKFLKGDSRQKTQELLEKFPDRFSLIESPEIVHISPGVKITTNHTKCMVIDYGKYFIMGGSGVKDNFAQTGLDDLPKEDFLRQSPIAVQKAAQDGAHQNAAVQEEGPEVEEDSAVCIEENEAEDIRKLEKIANELQEKNNGFVDQFLPGNFRDMDFVFSSHTGKNPVGRQIYKQMLLLAHRWEQYNRIITPGAEPLPNLNIAQLGAFNGKGSPIVPEDSVTLQLMKTRIPRWDTFTTDVPEFDNHAAKAVQVAFKFFASGPEQTKSQFAKELLTRIRNVKHYIKIDHMYFHPTDEILQALADAANRGVQIQIISAGVYEHCPASHHVFGPRNKYNYASLMNAIRPENQGNVEIFEFQQYKKGNHKKVVVIDDYVIAGSSNLGYKSLVSMSDHELNFCVRSAQVARKTLDILDIDIQHSVKVEDFRLSYHEYFRAGLHRVLAPLIG